MDNKYDLEVRVLKFAQDIVVLISQIENNKLYYPLLNQLLRSSTSIGANYNEANGASSKKDFCFKIHICKKEAKETLYWLQVLEKVPAVPLDQILNLTNEAEAFAKIFSKIASSSNNEK